MIENIIIRLIDMPSSIHGMTIYCPLDDTYNIYINARDSQNEQRETIIHECKHIKGNHFRSSESVSEVERGVQQ